MWKYALLLLLAAGAATARAERPILIHSHNDYARCVPFYQAYAQHAASIEVDLFLRDGQLLVGHDEEGLSAGLSFEKL